MKNFSIQSSHCQKRFSSPSDLNELNFELWLPTSAERAVKLHDRGQLRAPGAGK